MVVSSIGCGFVQEERSWSQLSVTHLQTSVHGAPFRRYPAAHRLGLTINLKMAEVMLQCRPGGTTTRWRLLSNSASKCILQLLASQKCSVTKCNNIWRHNQTHRCSPSFLCTIWKQFLERSKLERKVEVYRAVVLTALRLRVMDNIADVTSGSSTNSTRDAFVRIK